MIKKNNKYSLRKTTLGFGSIMIAAILMTTHVYADENTIVNNTNDSTTKVTEQDVNVVAESNNTASINEYNDDVVSEDAPTIIEVAPKETTNDTTDNSDTSITETNQQNATVTIYDFNATTGEILNQEEKTIDLTNKESDTINIPAESDKYRSKGFVYDGTINAETNNNHRGDITVTIQPNKSYNLLRAYRYVGINSGDKDTLVKIDNSEKKDMYFVGAVDENGKALETIGNTPYLSTGSAYLINGVLVWCAQPAEPATAGQKYIMKIIDEKEENALINNFGIGYGSITKDNYFLVDIEQGMMWQAQGHKNVFENVLINPDNSGSLRELTTEESTEMKQFISDIKTAIETYKDSSKKANLTYNDTNVSDTSE